MIRSQIDLDYKSFNPTLPKSWHINNPVKWTVGKPSVLKTLKSLQIHCKPHLILKILNILSKLASSLHDVNNEALRSFVHVNMQGGL
ncbi:hypothetical protein EX87_09710 [Brevibacillus laterosporus]|uniref:Uncharacterized protein n=1 Tax=Brevibacillus laterosporus TaxID=1465 RepID=A0A0F7BZJ2_BRELA|nr:hypothetical protein EX87_09710 [Brevibacillus laterosporus]